MQTRSDCVCKFLKNRFFLAPHTSASVWVVSIWNSNSSSSTFLQLLWSQMCIEIPNECFKIMDAKYLVTMHKLWFAAETVNLLSFFFN